MNTDTIIARALSGVGKKTIYSSPGKMPALAASEWPMNAANDCSGFLCWVLRFSKNRKIDHPLYKKVNGGYFETTGIHADGLHSTGFFTKIDDPIPGALLVYPDYKDVSGKRRDGHIGLVVESSGPGVSGAIKVVHCSLGNYRTKKDAIQVTGPDAWLKHSSSIIVWLDNWA